MRSSIKEGSKLASGTINDYYGSGDIFAGAMPLPNYLKTRTPQHIFNTMALTIREPESGEAYGRSCYHTVASAIGRGMVQPEDTVVLLGSPALGVFHAVVVDNEGKLVTDALANDDNIYDSQSGQYFGQFGGNKQRLEMLAHMKVGDFIREYVMPATRTPRNGPAP
jgi:hypothetical protein